MPIDLQIAAHFNQQVAADLFLPVLQGSKFLAQIQTAMATLALIADEHTSQIAAFCQAPDAPLKLRTLHPASIGQ